MASAQEVQNVLRFLSQDVKVPLAQALGKVKELQAAKLVTPEELAKADFPSLRTIFGDDKIARQVLNAAKRVSKKRSMSEASGATSVPSPKKLKPLYGQPLSASDFEASLALPEAILNEDVLKPKTVFTNRAPLVLAFTVALLKFTMPEQPLSSRLSLAQAVVSMNSKTKAVHIGIDSGKTAEDEGWGEGQPIVRIMNREVRVMKRWGYEWEETSTHKDMKREESTQGTVKEENSTQETLVGDEKSAEAKEPALWGIDLEALKRANSGPNIHKGSSQLPIHTAQSARAYLLKSFESPKAASTDTKAAPVKRTAASLTAEKERNLGMLLGALELLYQSWAHVLSKEELDRRAWGWYVRVRPEVASGQAGWGGKGIIKLADILELRRPAG